MSNPGIFLFLKYFDDFLLTTSPALPDESPEDSEHCRVNFNVCYCSVHSVEELNFDTLPV